MDTGEGDGGIGRVGFVTIKSAILIVNLKYLPQY